jgi:hypothetical protein
MKKLKPIVVKALKKRHAALFSGAFKPRVEKANKKKVYKRRAKNKRGEL